MSDGAVVVHRDDARPSPHRNGSGYASLYVGGHGYVFHAYSSNFQMSLEFTNQFALFSFVFYQ